MPHYFTHSYNLQGFRSLYGKTIHSDIPNVLSNHPLLRYHKPLRAAPLYKYAADTFRVLGRNNWYVWSFLTTASTIGIFAENTTIGAALSSPLITMGITLVACNLGLLPLSSPCYDTVIKTFVPLAIPLLLFDADIRKCFKYTGSLLKAFVIGSIGTLVGTLVAYFLVPMSNIVNSEKVAAALCARHIGGAINFVAVSDILKTPSDVIAAALAADNVIVALYFIFLFSITRASTMDEEKLDMKEISNTIKPSRISNNDQNSDLIQTLSIASAISLSFLMCAISELISFHTSISSVLITSSLAILSATSYPQLFGKLSKSAGILGVLFMQV